MVGLESAEPEWSLRALEALSGNAYRLRVVGSIAITAAYVAAGRFDALAEPAALPLGRRRGGAADRPRGGRRGRLRRPRLEDAPLDLDARYPIAAARDEAALAAVRAAQIAAESRVTLSVYRAGLRTFVREEHMFGTLGERAGRQANQLKGFIFMADSKNGSKSKTQAKHAPRKRKNRRPRRESHQKSGHQDAVARRTRRRPSPRPPSTPGWHRPQRQRPVSDMVEPWTSRTNAEKQLKSYRRQIENAKRTEKRGTTARRKRPPRPAKPAPASSAKPASTSARSRPPEAQPQRGRAARPPCDLEQTSRAQGLVDQVADQFSALR